MTINRKNCGGESRAINALIEQVSNIQEDLGQLQTEVNGLDNSKVSNEALAQSVTTESLTANHAQIGSTNISSEQLASNKVSAGLLFSPNADFEYEHANDGYIENLTSDAVTVSGTVKAVDVNATRISAEESLEVPSINTETVSATTVTASGTVSANNVSSTTVNANTATVATANVSTELNVKDLNITGNITGLNNVDINARSIVTPEIEADEIATGGIYTSEVNHLVPTPALDNNDHYTVMLPTFTGVMFLSWKDNDNNDVWTATVVGNGTDYSIHWGTSTGSTVYVTKVYQWNKHAYIRTNANGSLFYSYHTTEELEEPSVWYNYTALDNIDERLRHDCTASSGTITFGVFYAPSFTTGGTSIFEDIEVNGTATIANVVADKLLGKALEVSETETVVDPETEEETVVTHTYLTVDGNGISVVPETIVWNGTEVKVCDNFTTDWIQ